MRTSRRSWTWAVLPVLLAGCIADPDDARMDVPGDYLGSYSVEASLQESSCGSGSLSAPAVWSFDVQLSRDHSHLYWTNGAESIQGDLNSDGAFGFATEVSTTLKEAKPGRPGCVIWRQDAASGALALGDEETDVPSFDGKLTYTYAPGTGSECEELLDGAGLTQLPCTIEYKMSGTRLEE